MKIAVVIPTYQRIDKLDRCLKSLENQTYKNFWVNVYADNNDAETFNFASTWNTKLDIIATQMGQRSFVIGCWNDFFYSSIKIPGVKGMRNFDSVAWIVDDVELYPDYLEKCAEAMQNNFPDLDGVIGTTQECPGYPEYTYKVFGQVLLGRKFIERYANVNYQVCCPDYKHFFQDEEMWTFATKLNKFFYCKDAKLKHYHPGFIKSMLDSTHNIVRQPEIKNRDYKTRQERLSKGYLWGEDFNLVNSTK